MAARDASLLLRRLLPGDDLAQDMAHLLRVTRPSAPSFPDLLMSVLRCLVRAGVAPKGTTLANIPSALALWVQEQADG